jgi:hypothetical protein
MRRHSQSAEEEPEPPKIVTAMIPCEKGDPGAYLPHGAGSWYRDMSVNFATGETTPTFDEILADSKRQKEIPGCQF